MSSTNESNSDLTKAQHANTMDEAAMQKEIVKTFVVASDNDDDDDLSDDADAIKKKHQKKDGKTMPERVVVSHGGAATAKYVDGSTTPPPLAMKLGEQAMLTSMADKNSGKTATKEATIKTALDKIGDTPPDASAEQGQGGSPERANTASNGLSAPPTSLLRRSNRSTMNVYMEPGAYPVSSVPVGGGGSENNVPPTAEAAVVHSGQQQEAGAIEENVDQPPATTLLEAVAVEEDREKLQEEIRQQVLQEAVQADVVSTGPTTNHQKKIVLLLVVVLVLVVAVGLGLGLSRDKGSNSSVSSSNDGEPAATGTDTTSVVVDTRPTLEIVQERGYLICGLGEFVDWDPVKQELTEAFGVQYCKAMAMFALGDPEKIQPLWVKSSTRFELVQNRSVDIEIFGTTHNMGRDVLERKSQVGFAFPVPYFYSGLTFGGKPQYVRCAEQLDSFVGECRNLKICVELDTSHQDLLQEVLDGGAIVPGLVEGPTSFASSLEAGECNVVAGEPQALGRVLNNGIYTGEWVLASTFLSKEPLAFTTRQDDPHWTTMANIVVNAFFVAEARNITASEGGQVGRQRNLTSNGLRGRRKMQQKNLEWLLEDLVDFLGHHGDLFRRGMEPLIGPRVAGLNNVYTQNSTTGLLYAFPFGRVVERGPGPIPGGTLDTVQQRGYLICGVRTSRGPAFAANNETADGGDEWSGFDVGFCQGIAAAIFVGDIDKLVFVDMMDESDSYFALQNGTVDVVAGARVSLQTEYYEPLTGQGYSFSTPYYYDNDSKDAFAFQTRKEDVQWSDFVFWIVHALIYAEEKGITSDFPQEMPAVSLYGEPLKQMFRDCISVVGSYAELYNNTIEQHIPRAGANRLNEALAGPQLYPIPLE